MLYRIDLPNNPESKVLVEACLKALAARFDDAHGQTQSVTVDTGVGNAARISKIYGTLVMKDDAPPERLRRIARTLSAPAALEPVTETRPPAPTRSAGAYRKRLSSAYDQGKPVHFG